MISVVIRLALALLLLSHLSADVIGFTIERGNVAGIWKLQLQHPGDARDISGNALNTPPGQDIVLRLQDDGKFAQCNDDGDNLLKGTWEVDSEHQLLLALDRDCTPQDTLLTGKSAPSETKAKIKGTISSGKFMYPPSHMAFFEQPMAAAVPRGKFTLKQVLGFASPSFAVEQTQSAVEPAFQVSNFYGRKFFMTIVPIEANDPDAGERPVDIRTMPVEFFANNTFVAHATNKILRGRFEITGDAGNQLYFRVSRFGTGRSVPGSVYSEGLGLSHEDERTYVGEIQQVPSNININSLRVEGTVTFGADLGADARPEPVGTFLLTQSEDISLEMNDEEDEQQEKDIFDSVFE